MESCKKKKAILVLVDLIFEASAAAEQIEKDSVIIEKEKARENKQIDVAFWVWVKYLKYHKSALNLHVAEQSRVIKLPWALLLSFRLPKSVFEQADADEALQAALPALESAARALEERFFF